MKASLLSLILVVFMSCSSEEEIANKTSSSSSLIGKWELTEWNVDTAVDINGDNIASTNIMGNEIGCLSELSNITFVDDNSGTLYFNSDVVFFTHQEEGVAMDYRFICSTSDDKPEDLISYVVTDESTIEIDNDGDVSSLVLEGNTLSMTITNGFKAQDTESDVVTVQQDVTYVFSKI